MGESAVITGRKKGTFREKVTFFLVNRRTVLLLAADAANIDSGRYQSQQRPLSTQKTEKLNSSNKALE